MTNIAQKVISDQGLLDCFPTSVNRSPYHRDPPHQAITKMEQQTVFRKQFAAPFLIAVSTHGERSYGKRFTVMGKQSNANRPPPTDYWPPPKNSTTMSSSCLAILWKSQFRSSVVAPMMLPPMLRRQSGVMASLVLA